MQSRARRQDSVEDETLRLVQQHAGELLRFARRFSHCADDAHDAYQRTVEILVRRMRSDPPAQPLAWLRTVLRHEALAIRAERDRLLSRSESDLDRQRDRLVEDPAERAVGFERLRHTAEALRALKPQEVTALALRAEGLSYREICARTGWTYTRTNRAVTEGRRALRERLEAIESGADCARWLPLLSALADGEAMPADLSELRPHLRGCPACRATLRDFHAMPARVRALVPPAVAAGGGASHGPLLHQAGAALQALVERAGLLVARAQSSFEATPAAKLAAVAASTAALAGGGVALEQAARAPDGSHRGPVTAASTDQARLVPAAFPSRSSARAGKGQPRRSGAPRAEFAPAPAGPSEFAAPRASPVAEFAPRATAATVAAPRPAPAAPPGAPSEFSGP